MVKLANLKSLTILCVSALLILSGNTYAQEQSKPFALKLSDAAIERTEHNVTYDGSYFSIPYPNGDIPSDKGVCTDVVIRSYRTLGIDLQKLVHQDMKANFNAYPKIWGLTKTDTNIDHRRVPNLRVFFKRKGQALPISDNAEDYKPGDIVTWNIAKGWREIVKGKKNIPHIGIVTDKKSRISKRPLISHNIGFGPKLDDILFKYEMTGHYRYHPAP